MPCLHEKLWLKLTKDSSTPFTTSTQMLLVMSVYHLMGLSHHCDGHGGSGVLVPSGLGHVQIFSSITSFKSVWLQVALLGKKVFEVAVPDALQSSS